MAVSAFDRAMARRKPASASLIATSNRLAKLFFEHRGYVTDKWEHYLQIYEAVLAGRTSAGQPLRLLEIGVQNGGSLQIWSKYLSRDSIIVGIDIDPACAKLSMPENVQIEIGDARDPFALQSMLGKARFDVIIDDGTHRCGDIIPTFLACFDRLDWGGFYIIEDLHCSNFASHGGGFRNDRTAVEWFKGFTDCLNSDHFEPDADPKLSPSELQQLRIWGQQVAHVAFFDSVIMIQKLAAEKTSPYRRIITGRDSFVSDLARVIPNLPMNELRHLVLPPTAINSFALSLLGSLASAREEVGELRVRLAQADAVARDRANAAEVNAERLMGLEQKLTGSIAEVDSLRALLGARERELDAVARHLAAIQDSTSWKMTLPIRRVLERAPRGARVASRRTAKLVWWTMTGQVRSRLRARRQLLAPTSVEPGREQLPSRMKRVERVFAAQEAMRQPEIVTQHGSSGSLPAADGQWEWRGYAETRARIVEVLAARRSALSYCAGGAISRPARGRSALPDEPSRSAGPRGTARRWRAQQKNVTHQGSPSGPADDVVAADAAACASQPATASPCGSATRSRGHGRGLWRCHWCGCRCPTRVRIAFLRR
jgi:hypothetical protein